MKQSLTFFQEAVKGRKNIKYYLLTVACTVLAYMTGGFPLILITNHMVAKKNLTTSEVDEFYKTMDFTILGLSSNIGLILMILVFVVTMLVFMLCIKYFHQRPFLNLITPRPNINWKKIIFGFLLFAGLGILFEGFNAFLNPEDYYFNLKPLNWIFLLVISLTILPIQTSMEELFFRGYLMPGMAIFFKNKWMPLLITSILFGLVHGSNPEVEKFGKAIMMTYYIGAGLFLGFITILDDSLELALGVHAATNFMGAALFSFDGSVLQTDSLFKTSNLNPYALTGYFLLSAAIFTAICYKKYHWNWKRLLEKVDIPSPPEIQQPMASQR